VQTRWDLTLIWPQLVQHGPKLPLNSSFFLFKTDEMSAEEFENTSSMGQVVGREQFEGDVRGEQSEMMNSIQSLVLQMHPIGAVATD